MSLRHILNDDPTPYPISRTLSSDHVSYNDELRHSPRPASPSQHYVSQQHSRETLGGRSSYSTHHDPSWDSRSADWSTEDHTSAHPAEPRRHPYEQDRALSPMEPPASLPVEEEHEEEVPAKTRKRKGAKEDAEYQPSKPRRTSARKTRKSKETRTTVPTIEASTATNGHNVREEPPPDSSDLDDCPELWKPELDQYITETKKRQNQVAQYFWSHVLDRNSVTALDLSNHYSRKIESIPIAPPTPPLAQYVPPFEDDYESVNGNGVRVNGHDAGHRSRLNHGAEDAAMEFERDMLDYPGAKRKHGDKKRPLAADSDVGGEVDHPGRDDAAGPSTKKRKLENGSAVNGGEEPLSLKLSLSKLKGKAKQRETSQDSVSAASPKPSRKRAAPKKKTGLAIELETENGSRPPSVLGDNTPAHSRAGSPAPLNTSMVYELNESLPPLRKAKKVDDVTLLKRVKTLEENQKKVWTNIARRDVHRVYKAHTTSYHARRQILERTAKHAATQARKPFVKTAKATKDLQAKAKRLMREMQVFWKKNEKEERDVRKREQKEANDRIKVEEEKREAARQARKLEFLISQTELYSHFVGSKLKTAELEGNGEPTTEDASVSGTDGDGPGGEPLGGEPLPEINFDDEDRTNLHRHARQNAQEALALARQRAVQFDATTALERKTNEALKLAKAQAHIHRDMAPETEEVQGEASTSTSKPLVDLDSDELNFQNPTSLTGPLTIGQPKMLMAQLKEYQLKGLNWLATLYEQGINGILADEMGLGKTVQSISLLAYLAETHDIWGPFLVVAPASTLHNWQQELSRFVPQLKAIPYWGNVKDRATLRKFWSKKEITYNKDAPFHILITSYQLITQDQQYFQRVKWQYMILDEAQNIKNSASVRWKTLLGFQCRNRLLLTGTPIQNSMQELWALLHFIMPSLFDSHDEFNEWFSKDIENAAENKGSRLNEHQLRRLHMILKPFMLRRIKRNVQNELSEKIEIDIYVDLSARQRSLYSALLANVSVADLLEKARNIGDADSARSLMNLVMQFRKVCNHPELFERADVIAPFSFCHFGRPGPLMREGDFVLMPYSTRSLIEYSIPTLLYEDGGLLDVPSEASKNPTHTEALTKLMNIWTTDWMHKSLYHDDSSTTFSFLRFLNLPASEAHEIHVSPVIRRQLLTLERETTLPELRYSSDPDFSPYLISNHLRIPSVTALPKPLIVELPEPKAISLTSWHSSCLSRPAMRWYTPSVVAPPLTIHSNDRTFVESQTYIRDAPVETLAFYGLPYHLRNSEPAAAAFHKIVPVVSPAGLANSSPQDQVPLSNMVVPEAKRLIYDSAKLSRLDSLLQELKVGDHRVLIYSQMTKMLDLMEEYLIFRQYKYLRLDGSSKLEDRRDMVIDWQTRPDIFVFLLSTRAGGLGINLTAADTVVFYDHDWNPSNDAQAMDRAHRLGQTRQVTVYRLVTKGTIDERIVQLARVKKDVQDIVVGNKNLTDVTKPSEIVQLLLNDAQIASLGDTNKLADVSNSKNADDKQKQAAVRDMWNDDGDDFFGHNAGQTTFIQEEPQEAPTTSTRGRRGRGGGRGRGRKPGRGRKGDSANAAFDG